MNGEPLIETITSDQGITSRGFTFDLDGTTTMFVEADAISKHVELYRDALRALTRATLDDLRRGYGLHEGYTDEEVVVGLADIHLNDLAAALKAALVILALGDKSRAGAK